MQVKSIAECSKGMLQWEHSAIRSTFIKLLYHLQLRPMFRLFLSGRLKQVILYNRRLAMTATCLVIAGFSCLVITTSYLFCNSEISAGRLEIRNFYFAYLNSTLPGPNILINLYNRATFGSPFEYRFAGVPKVARACMQPGIVPMCFRITRVGSGYLIYRH